MSKHSLTCDQTMVRSFWIAIPMSGQMDTSKNAPFRCR